MNTAMASAIQHNGRWNRLIFIWLLTALPSFAADTTIWINNAPSYSSLTSCASTALSHIVRAQASGCGMTNSWGCFCTDSSTLFASIISREAVKTCGNAGQPEASQQVFASSAQDVFAGYCSMGIAATASASPTPTSPAVTSTSTPYIDALPDYSNIAPCARNRLETIVKDMSSGCGDGSQYTSYNCFCNEKSSSVNSVISTDVFAACHDNVLVGQAQAVFSEYCEMDKIPLTKIQPVINAGMLLSIPTRLARKREKKLTCIRNDDLNSINGRKSFSSHSNLNPPPLAATTDTSSSSSGGLAQSTIIAVAVCVPVVVLAVALMIFLLWRHNRRHSTPESASPEPGSTTSGPPTSQNPFGDTSSHQELFAGSTTNNNNGRAGLAPINTQGHPFAPHAKGHALEVPDTGIQELFTPLPATGNTNRTFWAHSASEEEFPADAKTSPPPPRMSELPGDTTWVKLPESPQQVREKR